MEKWELVHTDGDLNWCSHFEKQCENLLRRLKLELIYDPANPLMRISSQQNRLTKEEPAGPAYYDTTHHI